MLLREHVSPLLDSDAKLDRFWLGSSCAPYAKIAELIADFIANVVVEMEFKGSLRTAVQARKDPIDFLDCKYPAEAVGKIKAMYADEKLKWEKATADRKSIVDAQAEQEKQAFLQDVADNRKQVLEQRNGISAANLKERIEAAMVEIPFELRDELKKLETILNCMGDRTRNFWQTDARKSAASLVRLVHLPALISHKERVRILSEKQIVTAELQMQHGNIILYFDVKQSGQALSHPQARLAPFRELDFRRNNFAFLEARWGGRYK